MSSPKSYLTRIYNRDKINANIREFRGLISEKLRGIRDADELADDLKKAEADLRKAAASLPITRLAYSINDFIKATGLCRTSIYAQIKLGMLRPIKVGKRTLIPVAEGSSPA